MYWNIKNKLDGDVAAKINSNMRCIEMDYNIVLGCIVPG